MAAIAFEERADTRPLHQALVEIRARDSEAIKSAADSWLICTLAERDPAAASDALAAMGTNGLGSNTFHFHQALGEGLRARMMNDAAKAQTAFTAARMDQEQRLRQDP